MSNTSNNNVSNWLQDGTTVPEHGQVTTFIVRPEVSFEDAYKLAIKACNQYEDANARKAVANAMLVRLIRENDSISIERKIEIINALKSAPFNIGEIGPDQTFTISGQRVTLKDLFAQHHKEGEANYDALAIALGIKKPEQVVDDQTEREEPEEETTTTDDIEVQIINGPDTDEAKKKDGHWYDWFLEKTFGVQNWIWTVAVVGVLGYFGFRKGGWFNKEKKTATTTSTGTGSTTDVPVYNDTPKVEHDIISATEITNLIASNAGGRVRTTATSDFQILPTIRDR